MWWHRGANDNGTKVVRLPVFGLLSGHPEPPIGAGDDTVPGMGDSPWQGDACSLVEEFRSRTTFADAKNLQATYAAIDASNLERLLLSPP